MFCLTCGSALERSQAYCVHCGSPTGQGAVAAGTGPSSGLQPLGVGERIDASFKAYFANFTANAKAVLVVAIPFGLLEALITTSTTSSTGQLLTTTYNANGQPQLHVDKLWTYVAGLLAVTVISEIVALWVSATTTLIVGGMYVGEPVPWRTALGAALRRLGSMLWIFLLLLVIYLAPLVIVVGLAVIFFATHVTLAGVLVSVLGGLAYLAFVVWFYTAQSLVVPTLMLEDVRGLAAIQRSVTLSRNSWLSMFGTLFLATLIVTFATTVLSALVTAGLSFAHHDTILALFLSTIERTIVLVLLTPFTATVLVVLAIDMRVRKEGFDLELLANQLRAPASAGPAPTTSSGSGFPALGASPESWSLPEPPSPPESQG